MSQEKILGPFDFGPRKARVVVTQSDLFGGGRVRAEISNSAGGWEPAESKEVAVVATACALALTGFLPSFTKFEISQLLTTPTPEAP